MLIKDINEYNLTFKSIIKKFNLYHTDNKTATKNDNEPPNLYNIVKHYPFTFIIYLDKETQSNNCYCQELKEFIKPYKFLLLFSSSIDTNQFRQIIQNIFNKHGHDKFNFSQSLTKQQAKNKIYAAHKIRDYNNNIIPNPNYSTEIDNIIYYTPKLERQKIILHNFSKHLKITSNENIVEFTPNGYYYLFNNIKGFNFTPSNPKEITDNQIDFYCNPILFLNQADPKQLNIISNNRVFNLDDIKILKPTEKTLNLHFNINNSKDLYFIFAFIINYYNYAIGKYFIRIDYTNKYYCHILFYHSKNKPDNTLTDFFTSMNKNYHTKFFDILSTDLIPNYIYNEFNFNWAFNMNSNSTIHTLTMYLKKQFIIIFIKAFYDFFLTKSNINFFPYAYDKETKNFNPIQLFP